MRDDVARALAAKALEVAQKAKSQQGPKGEKGEPGQIIVQPNKGDQGEQGPMGPQGIPGKSISGPKGDKGDRGEAGTPGEKGDKGDKGDAGEKGERGERGFQGVKGLNGSQGLIGPMPKHEKKGLMIRFEKEPGTWGDWIIMPTGGGGGGRDDKLTDRQAELVALAEFYKTRGANANKFIKTDGTTLSWDTLDGSDINLASPPPIGATTPSTINATTLSGQTGVLRGTGTNLVLQSGWAGGTSGVIGSGAVAPTSWAFFSTAGSVTYASALSGSGNSIRFVATASERPGLQQTVSLSAGMVYSAVFTVEAVNSGSPTLNQLFVTTGTTTSQLYYVNGVLATAGTIATAGTKVQIVTTILTIVGTTTVRYGLGVNSAIAGDITLANPQLEIGSVVNTYIPTTTTAVYGTPTLSFSGVSEIGLQSNGALYLQPAGTGAIQAQATTSTTAGGNVRGANAVDWSTFRGSASNVASGAFSVLSGGISNTTSGFSGVVSGGSTNQATNFYSFVGGGQSNTASNFFSSVNGGFSNTSAGYFNFIGNGQSNSGTSGSAVTTQSGTMNGTTAVTLSGSNANIRVGQLITGTSIANYTYVAAISGTSLTLSQAASGSSTSTLSFFTPHGVVVGGGNNQATGSYSFIGGGGDAGTSANRNVASGSWSTVAGGWKNTASGEASVVAGGGSFGGGVAGNTASGTSAFVGAGYSNTAGGYCSMVIGGASNNANQNFTSVLGGSNGIGRSIAANTVFPASSGPVSSTVGSSQSALLVLGRQTTDATATALCSDSSAAGTTNQVILPNNSAYLFKATVISNVTGGGNTSGWKLEGVIKRGANAASTTIVGSVTTTLLAQDAGASGWVIAATADTTNGGLRITFTGQASTTIRTVCKVETTEVTF